MPQEGIPSTALDPFDGVTPRSVEFPDWTKPVWAKAKIYKAEGVPE